ncbi:MAG: signal peptidase I [Propionibacteriaceae bacterium]|jgi:signal peptidase I|nr:signal peptidase I [Propionibacteriaceae bacterium]
MSRPARAQRPSVARRIGGLVLNVVVILVLASVISTLLRTFVVEQYHVPTQSMELTIQPGDRIAVSRFSDIQRGSVVVFRDDLGWDAPQPDTRPLWRRAAEFVGFLPKSTTGYLVKRVIGLPGDHVTCCDAEGRLSVNGVAVVEPYLYSRQGSTAASNFEFDVTVPAGHIFVLGDHRDESADSRFHWCSADGVAPDLVFPSLDSVRGPVVAVVWPHAHWSKTAVNEQLAAIPTVDAAPDVGVVSVPETC